MEVSAGVHELLHLELGEFPADHVPHAVITLEFAFYLDEGREPYNLRELLHHLLGDDDIDEAELIFHQQEHGSFRALWLLADGDETCCLDPLSASQLEQLIRVEDIPGAQLFAQVLHRMAADADPNREIIHENQLIACERTRLVRHLARRRQRQTISDRAHRHPRCSATVGLPAAECTGASELQRISTLKLCSVDNVFDRRKAIPASRCLERIE